jgi:hypothetical protein
MSAPVNPFIRPRTREQRRRGLEDEWNDYNASSITQMSPYQPRYYPHVRYTVDYPYFTNNVYNFIRTVAATHDYSTQYTALTTVAQPLHAAQRSYLGQSLAGPPPQLGITPEILRAWWDLMSTVCAHASVNAYLG